MSKAFRSYNPDQLFLILASIQEWLPPDHLDLSAVMSRYEDEKRGYPPNHPQVMVQEDRCYGKGQERVGAARSTGCTSACPSPCRYWTQIMAGGSSTSAFTPAVAG